MTTTDTDALQERIARILHDEGWTFEGIHEPGEYDECEDCRRVVAPIAARIAQGIAAEVQAAKAGALREMQEHHEREADKAQTIAARGIHLTIAGGARSRATKYETGGRA